MDLYASFDRLSSEERKFILVGPKLDMLLSLKTKADDNYNDCEVHVKFAQKGFQVNERPFNTDWDFKENLKKAKGQILVLFTNQSKEFNRLNRLAKEVGPERQALIVWGGDEKTKPAVQDIPVLSTERLFLNKNRIEPEALLELAKETAPIKKYFWKNILKL